MNKYPGSNSALADIMSAHIRKNNSPQSNSALLDRYNGMDIYTCTKLCSKLAHFDTQFAQKYTDIDIGIRSTPAKKCK